MNLDIKEQFSLKNLEIFKRKLNIDIDNCFDSFVLSINNFVDFETTNCKSRIVKIYEENQIQLKETDFELIDKLLKNICSEFLSNLKTTTKEIKYRKSIEIDFINKNNIKDKLKIIKNNDNLNGVFIKKDDIKEFLTDIKNINLKINKDNINDRIDNYLYDGFINRFNDKTNDLLNIRLISLNNMFEDSYMYFEKLEENV